MSPRARGTRVRPVAELAEGLAYLRPPGQPRTDVLVFTLVPPGGRQLTRKRRA